MAYMLTLWLQLKLEATVVTIQLSVKCYYYYCCQVTRTKLWYSVLLAPCNGTQCLFYAILFLYQHHLITSYSEAGVSEWEMSSQRCCCVSDAIKQLLPVANYGPSVKRLTLCFQFIVEGYKWILIDGILANKKLKLAFSFCCIYWPINWFIGRYDNCLSLCLTRSSPKLRKIPNWTFRKKQWHWVKIPRFRLDIYIRTRCQENFGPFRNLLTHFW